MGGSSGAGGAGGTAGSCGAAGTGGSPAVCGDGTTSVGEACDDGPANGCGACNSTCSGTGGACSAACAGGAPAQTFQGGMVGCKGKVTFPNRAPLCAAGSVVCDWTGCGWLDFKTNDWFGGCNNDFTAGALCCLP